MNLKNKLLNLAARVEFWYAKTFVRQDKHFQIMYDLGIQNMIAIKCLTKKYEGVIFGYDLSENLLIHDDGQMNLDFYVIANPNLKDVESKGFQRFSRNVFRNILMMAVENAKGYVNENRIADPIELDEERTVHEEGTAVSEERIPARKPRKKAIRTNKDVHPKV